MTKSKIKRLLASAEVNQRAFYFLSNHVKRSDDEDIAKAADELCLILKRKAEIYRKKANDMANS